MRFVFVSARINLGDEGVEIRIGAQRPLGNQFLSTSRAFLVAGPKRRDDAVVTKSRTGGGMRNSDR